MNRSRFRLLSHGSFPIVLPMAQSCGLEQRLRAIVALRSAKRRPATRRLRIGVAATACAIAMPLAFVQPSVSAKAGATEREHRVLRPVPGTWTVVTPLGSRVTLIGVLQDSAANGKWWTPDGKPLAERPRADYSDAPRTVEADSALISSVREIFGRRKLSRCILSITDPPYSPNSHPAERIGVFASDAGYEGNRPVSSRFTVQLSPCLWNTGDSSFSTNLGVGAWTTLARADKSGARNCIAWYGGKRIVTDIAPFIEVRDFRDTARAWETASVVAKRRWLTVHSAIRTSYPPGSDFRIRMIGKDGKDIYVQRYPTFANGRQTSSEATFFTGYRSDLRIADIKEVLVQVRPSRVLTFENIAGAPKETAE